MQQKTLKRIMISIFTPFFIVALFVVLFFVGEKNYFMPVQAADSSEAIGVRVMPNPDHLSPLSWYYKNVPNKGKPMSIVVNGYEAVRDGRSVYVNAANIEPNPMYSKLHTNIYIISYNQEAENETKDIFGQILKYWKFNADLVRRTGEGKCLPITEKQSCQTSNDCQDNFRGYTCEQKLNDAGKICVKKCTLDSDCGQGKYCDSQKSKLVRDVKRLSDLFEINAALKVYKKKYGTYPRLPSGSYLPDRTISVWPSWNQSFGKTLGYQIPLDPINKLDRCTGFNPVTCWNEKQKIFATDFGENNVKILPDDPDTVETSHAYVYFFDEKQDKYKFCTNFELNLNNYKLADKDEVNPFIIHQCDQWLGGPTPVDLKVIVGNCVRPEGKFNKCFIAAYGKYDIDWNKTKINLTPTSPTSWGGWADWGWQWSSGKNQLSLGNTSLKSHKELSANKIILPNDKYYGIFKYAVTIYDVQGNSNKGVGTIKICNPVTCSNKNYECSSLPSVPPSDNCGGFLSCGGCPSNKLCIDYKCK